MQAKVVNYTSAQDSITCGAIDLSGRELRRVISGHLAMLHRLGVAPSDRIGLWADSRIETVVAVVAQLLGGFQTVLLNPSSGQQEVDYILNDAEVKYIVAVDPHHGHFRKEVPIVSMSLCESENDPPLCPEDPTDPALILYTSGTTSRPKGVIHTWETIQANLNALGERWRWECRGPLVHALPLFHVHGLILGVLGPLYFGQALVLAAPFKVKRMAEVLSAHSRAMMFGVPTMYQRLARTARELSDLVDILCSADLCISGSAPIPLSLQDEWTAITGRGLYDRYGLTETLINTAVDVSGDPTPGRVGQALAGVELDVRTEAGTQGNDKLGEVWVRGPSVFAGYLKSPDNAASSDKRDGWFQTGDVGRLHDDGSLELLGRLDTDIIKTGGFKVGALEIERCLLSAPGVIEAAVIGVDDHDLGERIEAFVVVDDQEKPQKDLSAFVSEQLAHHKRPRVVHFCDDLPKNAMGKVQKRKLKSLRSDYSNRAT